MGGGSAGADGDGQHTQKGDGVACTVYGKGKIGSCKIIIGKKYAENGCQNAWNVTLCVSCDEHLGKKVKHSNAWRIFLDKMKQ